MPAYVFERISKKAQAANVDLSLQEPKSILWFRNAAKVAIANPNTMMKNYRDRLKNYPLLGRMYLFAYDPKWKNELPYYDTFPLVIPFDSIKTGGKAGTSQGFMGLNLHYLPPILRARLMNAIYHGYLSRNKLDEKTRMKLSYQLLRRVAELRFFKPCVKQYLFNYTRSKFLLIDPSEWDMAMMLPLQRFQKATTNRIYKESREIIG